MLINFKERKNEYDADTYAVKLGYGTAMYNGLIRNYAENKDQIFSSNYNAFLKSSHPKFLPRLAAIQKQNEALDVKIKDSEPEMKIANDDLNQARIGQRIMIEMESIKSM